MVMFMEVRASILSNNQPQLELIEERESSPGAAAICQAVLANRENNENATILNRNITKAAANPKLSKWQRFCYFFKRIFGFSSAKKAEHPAAANTIAPLAQKTALQQSYDNLNLQAALDEPVSIEKLDAEEIQKREGKSTYIRKEIVSTEKTFHETLTQALGRIEILMALKQGYRLKGHKLADFKEKMNIPQEVDCKDYIKNLRKNVQAESISSLNEMKRRYAYAIAASADFIDQLEACKDNDEVFEVYHNMLKDSRRAGYVKSIAACAVIYKRLVGLDTHPLAPNTYSTAFQRMPRHRLFLADLERNSISKHAGIFEKQEKVSRWINDLVL